jgi:hypothetical protein
MARTLYCVDAKGMKITVLLYQQYRNYSNRWVQNISLLCQQNILQWKSPLFTCRALFKSTFSITGWKWPLSSFCLFLLNAPWSLTILLSTPAERFYVSCHNAWAFDDELVCWRWENASFPCWPPVQKSERQELRSRPEQVLEKMLEKQGQRL